MKYKKYKVLSERVIIDKPYAHLIEQKVEFANGEEGVWYVNNKALDGVFVLPRLKDGRFVIEETYRHGIENVMYECIGGGVEPGEDLELAVKREAEEETGLLLGDLVFLGSCYAAAGKSKAKQYFYYAKDCEYGGAIHPDSAEQIEVLFCDTEKEVEEKLLGGISGRCGDSKSMVLWSLYKKYKHETA